MKVKENFSFKKAVAEACRDFPGETKNIVFLDLSTPGARERFHQWSKGQRDDEGRSISAEAADRQFDELHTEHGFAAIPGSGGGKSLLAYSADYDGYAKLLPRQFIFDHELGHLVAKGGISQRPQPGDFWPVEQIMGAIARAESVADGFAVLRGIKRGSMNVDDGRQLAVLRATTGWKAGIYSHMTSTAIDALLSGQGAVSIRSLTPQQQKDLAYENMGENSAGPAGIGNIIRFIEELSATGGKGTVAERIVALADIVMKKPPESLAFRIAGRVLSEAFRTGTVDYVGALTTFAPKEKWLDAARALKSRTKEADAPLLTDFDENKLEMLLKNPEPKQGHPAFAVLRKLKTPAV